MKIWKKVDIAASSGIALHPNEVFGDSFVYKATADRAKEVYGASIRANWGSYSGACVTIPKSSTRHQAMRLRELVLLDIQRQQESLDKVADALQGIDRAQMTLGEVRAILEG